MSIATILKHNVMGKLLNHLVVFGINVFLARFMGPSYTGTYFNELYVLNFIVFVFSAGLDYAAITLASRDPGLLPAIHKMMFRAVLLFSAIMLLYAFVLLPWLNNYFRQPLVAIAMFSIGNLMLIFYQGVLSAMKKFNRQNIILLVTNLFFLIYLIGFTKDKEGQWIRLGNIYHVETVYASVFLVQGLLMCFSSISFNVKKAVPLSWGVFIKSGVCIMLSSLIFFAFLRVDNFFVQKYTDDITLGNYVQCGKIGQYFLYFSSVISSTLIPFIAAETIGNSYEEWKKMMKPYILLLCVTALVIGFTGQYVFPVLFGGGFHGMHVYMNILLPGFVCLGMLTLMNAVYIGKGNVKRILAGDLLGLLMVTVLDGWFVPEYGALAAAIISSVSYCVVFMYLLIGFRQQFSLPRKI